MMNHPHSNILNPGPRNHSVKPGMFRTWKDVAMFAFYGVVILAILIGAVIAFGGLLRRVI